MTVPAITPLGAATLVKKWRLDVNTGTHDSAVWIPVRGLSDFKPSIDPTKKDDSDLNSDGWGSDTITKLAWGVDGKVWRKTDDASATAYDAGQEVLRLASAQLGVGNHVEVRFYEMTSGGPKVEAYQGYASVEWKPDGGGMDDLDGVSVTLNGQGLRNSITHPDTGGVVPTTASVTPATGPAAGGTLVRIVGTGFFKAGIADVSGATGVKFGSTNATTYTVESDNVIHAVAPAVGASIIAVKVTNSVGASVTMANYEYTT